MAAIPQVSLPLVLVDTANLPEEEWLAYRRNGIGGSDAAAILGVSPFATARDLYYDKLNIVGFSDPESNWVAKRVGHLLEDLVAEIFHRKIGYEIYQIKKMFCHPFHTFMLADVDYFVTLPNRETAILEIKTTNYNTRDRWWLDGEEIVPVNYEIQGRHYMAVMNANRVYYCCLYGNSENEVIIRHIDRDLEYEQELIELERIFWQDHVLARVPPDYTEDGDLVMESVLRHLAPADPQAPAVDLTKTQASRISRYLELQRERTGRNAQLNRIEQEMGRLQGQIVAEMGRSCKAACAIGDDTYTVTFNPFRRSLISKDNLTRLQAQHPEIYDDYVTISESRRFRIKKERKEAA